MPAFVVVGSALFLLALLSVLVLIPCLCACATGRALGWVFDGNSDKEAHEVDELRSREHLAEIDALVATSQRMARDAQRRADARPSAR